MKKIVTVITAISVIWALGCAQTAKNTQTQQSASSPSKIAQEPQLYTAYNIWRVRTRLMRCINYKHGTDIIPAGTMVKNVEVKKRKSDEHYHVKRRNYISFTTLDDDRVYQINFTTNWHPGKTAEDYKNLMITPKNFEELTEGMSENEIGAIRNATVINGMSKRAVLASYGYPPEHRTSSLDNNVWVYWRNKMGTFDICFDEDGRTTFCK